jgi:hypothetical protein
MGSDDARRPARYSRIELGNYRLEVFATGAAGT